MSSTSFDTPTARGGSLAAGARSATLRRDLAAIQADGASFSFMVGAGEAYIPAFALALGLGDIAAGLVSAAPIVVGSALQLVSPWAVRRLGSTRRWVVGCAALQAMSFLPLIAGALLGWMPLWALLAVASLYWGAGMATGPAWNTWVGEIVPPSIRTRFFASRTRVTQTFMLLGLVAAGLLLHEAGHGDWALLGFAIIFSVSLLARALSALFLSRQSEPARLRAGLMEERRPRTRDGRARRLLVYLLAVHASVYIAAPFFTPYMLGPLGLNYMEFMLLTAMAFVGKILALPLIGRIGRRIGARRLLYVSGVSIVPIAALWNVSDDLVYLAWLQVLAGVVWGAYELASFLLFFDEIEVSERTRVLTLFNLGSGLALFFGAWMGAGLLAWLGTDAHAYHLVFLISSLARAATLLLLRRLPDAEVPIGSPAFRTLAARPSAGSIDRPVTAAFGHAEEGLDS